jgi:hypothetical protein
MTDIGATLQSVLVPSCAAGRRPIDVLLGCDCSSATKRHERCCLGESGEAICADVLLLLDLLDVSCSDMQVPK